MYPYVWHLNYFCMSKVKRQIPINLIVSEKATASSDSPFRKAYEFVCSVMF